LLRNRAASAGKGQKKRGTPTKKLNSIFFFCVKGKKENIVIHSDLGGSGQTLAWPEKKEKM